MIRTLLDRHFPVGPHGPQNQVSMPFNFSAPAMLTTMNVKLIKINATGMINSGVWFTGQTPPSGWSMLADDPNWPLNTSTDPSAPRYGLIGTFDPPGTPTPNWFFIGESAIILAGDPSIPDIPAPGATSDVMRTLHLAVNEPNPDDSAPGPHNPARGLLGDGDGFWDVHVQVLETDISSMMDMMSALSCSEVNNLLLMQRSRANHLCSAIGRVKEARDSDLALARLAWSTFLGFLAALAGVSGNIAGAHIVILGSVPDPTPAGLGERIAAAVAALAGSTVAGAPTAAAGGWGTELLFWGLVAATVIVLALAIAATVVYMNDRATFENGVSQWSGILNSIQHLIDAAGRLGCSVDTSLPTCAALP